MSAEGLISTVLSVQKELDGLGHKQAELESAGRELTLACTAARDSLARTQLLLHKAGAELYAAQVCCAVALALWLARCV